MTSAGCGLAVVGTEPAAVGDVNTRALVITPSFAANAGCAKPMPAVRTRLESAPRIEFRVDSFWRRPSTRRTLFRSEAFFYAVFVPSFASRTKTVYSNCDSLRCFGADTRQRLRISLLEETPQLASGGIIYMYESIARRRSIRCTMAYDAMHARGIHLEG